MTKFIVKGFVKYNGKQYVSGSVVEVQDKDVQEFKKFGWQIVEEKPSENLVEDEKDNEKDNEKDDKKEPEVEELTKEQIEALYKEKPELVGLTNAQLEALLEENGVEFVKGSKKAILLAYLA